MKGSAPRTLDSVALAAGFHVKSKSSTDKTLFCRYCKKVNHVIEDCLKLKNKKAREGSSSSFGSNQPRFSGCVAGDVQSTTGGDSSNSEGGTDSAPMSMSLSSSEFARLKLFLQQPASQSPPVNYANFVQTPSTVPLPSTRVTLPTGETSMATHSVSHSGPSISINDWFSPGK
ncbi:hypothetical protein LINGRAPRIM_LOCUS773 [Linum grandiflorum]